MIDAWGVSAMLDWGTVGIAEELEKERGGRSLPLFMRDQPQIIWPRMQPGKMALRGATSAAAASEGELGVGVERVRVERARRRVERVVRNCILGGELGGAREEMVDVSRSGCHFGKSIL